MGALVRARFNEIHYMFIVGRIGDVLEHIKAHDKDRTSITVPSLINFCRQFCYKDEQVLKRYWREDREWFNDFGRIVEGSMSHEVEGTFEDLKKFMFEFDFCFPEWIKV